MPQPFRIGLALGGGAARALSHIGVIEGLEAHGISVDVVTGTSMGAIIGALWAADRDISATRRRMEEYLSSEPFRRSKFDFMREKDAMEGQGIFFRFSSFTKKTYFYWMSMMRPAFVSDEMTQENFKLLVSDGRIEELKVPFAAIALDLISGQEVILNRGELRPALTATCALPGILSPVPHNAQLLVDGGWIDAVPVEPAFILGADMVIGVDVSRRLSEFEAPASGLDIVFRCDAITRYALAGERLRRADVVLSPEVKDVHWADFSRSADLIERGRQEVDRRIGEIRRRIRTAKLRRFYRPRWGRLVELSPGTV